MASFLIRQVRCNLSEENFDKFGIILGKYKDRKYECK